VFSFKDGQLANRGSIAPNGGYGFGPRNLDFHPGLPLVYVSLERQNRLDVYRWPTARSIRSEGHASRAYGVYS
jgi:6-phosphogluconolactonase (cycloisomerase 2 family)